MPRKLGSPVGRSRTRPKQTGKRKRPQGKIGSRGDVGFVRTRTGKKDERSVSSKNRKPKKKLPRQRR
jgi:hypothetical protein